VRYEYLPRRHGHDAEVPSFVVWHHLVIDLVIILLVNLRIVLVNMLSVVVLFLGSDGSVFRT
jgi:hypothetical protein